MHEGRPIPLDRRFVLGREPGRGGLRVLDGAISRRHARFEWHADHGLVELEDLKSKNHTFVNGLITTRRYLDGSDVVRMGDTIMLVCDGARRDGPHALPEAAGGEAPPLAELVGRSAAVAELKARLVKAAPGTLPVLLLGQTGTGKELAARALHGLSGRTGVFEAVNCASIPDGLFESTFYGHRRGAFTGALDDSAGLLAACDGGTLLLDEMGELPPAAQPKLLRFLEDGLVRPVGGTRSRHVDVRVVAATNSPLVELEQEGRFRSDLFARFESLIIPLPALNDRREDILPLVRFFAASRGFHGVGFEPDAVEALLIARWPRNIRELRSLVAHQAQMVWTANSPEVTVEVDQLPESFTGPLNERGRAPAAPILKKHTRPSREELAAAIERHQGNILRVAGHYGRDRKQIYRWMEQHGLK